MVEEKKVSGPRMPSMPLSLVRSGKTVTVSQVRGSEDVKHHLENLGFVASAEVRVISSGGGNIIVLVKGSRLGLDNRVARYVMTT